MSATPPNAGSEAVELGASRSAAVETTPAAPTGSTAGAEQGNDGLSSTSSAIAQSSFNSVNREEEIESSESGVHSGEPSVNPSPSVSSRTGFSRQSTSDSTSSDAYVPPYSDERHSVSRSSAFVPSVDIKDIGIISPVVLYRVAASKRVPILLTNSHMNEVVRQPTDNSFPLDARSRDASEQPPEDIGGNDQCDAPVVINPADRRSWLFPGLIFLVIILLSLAAIAFVMLLMRLLEAVFH